VVAEGYQAVVFEQEAPLRSGQAVRLTRAEVKPSAVADVVDVYGDTAVPRLADTPVSAARCCSLIRPAGSYSAGS
jgi:hypothetical protein